MVDSNTDVIQLCVDRLRKSLVERLGHLPKTVWLSAVEILEQAP